MNKELEEKVREIFREEVQMEVDIDEIGAEEELADYGMNSMRVLKLIMSLEERFGFEVCDEDFNAKNFMSIQMIVAFIEEKMLTY